MRVAWRHEGRHALLGEFLGRSLKTTPANIIRPCWQIVNSCPIAGMVANLLSHFGIVRITLHENGLVQWLDAAAHGVKVIQVRDTIGSGLSGRGIDGCRQEKHQRGYDRHGEGRSWNHPRWSAGNMLHCLLLRWTRRRRRSARTRKRHDMCRFLVLALAPKDTTQNRRAHSLPRYWTDDSYFRLHRKVQCAFWRRPPAASRFVFRRRR